MLDMAALLQKVATEGWDAFDETKLREAQKASDDGDRSAAYAEAQIVAAALNTDAGKRFIEWLASKTIHRPPSAAEIAVETVEASALMAERRKGQNQIFFMIAHALAVAAGDDPDVVTDPSPVKRRTTKRGSDAA